jgi:hypothetical protein
MFLKLFIIFAKHLKLICHEKNHRLNFCRGFNTRKR